MRRRRLILIRVLVFSICIIASAVLLMIPREQHMAGSDIVTKTQYGLPLAWRTSSPVNTVDKDSYQNLKSSTTMDSQKLIINILIFGSVTTVLLFATSVLEKHQ